MYEYVRISFHAYLIRDDMVVLLKYLICTEHAGSHKVTFSSILHDLAEFVDDIPIGEDLPSSTMRATAHVANTSTVTSER